MKYFALVPAILLGLILSACQSSEHKTDLKTFQDSVSYSIGMDIGKNLKGQMIDVNPEALAQAIKDIKTNAKPMLTEDQAHTTMVAFQSQMMAMHMEKMKAAGEKNKKDGEAFLAENKKKEGVVTLASGLQYQVLTMGKGKKPTMKDNVKVHYIGSLIDGTEFDNSYKRGEPAVFPLKGVIKGLGEALQMMPVGSKWKVFVPSGIGYGEQGAGTQIPPNAVLVFELEVLGIM